MNIEKQNKDGICKVQVEGEMTIFTADEVLKNIFEDYAECSGMELDLSQVNEMDTAGFQLLYMAKKEAKESDRTFRIVSHSPAVESVLELFNVDKEGLANV